MRSADWRRTDCRRCTRLTAGRCGCAASCSTCAAFEMYHTRTADAQLASPAELHHVTAAAAGTNSVARGWLWHSNGNASLQHRCSCWPAGEMPTTLPVSNSRQPSYGGCTIDALAHECSLLQLPPVQVYRTHRQRHLPAGNYSVCVLRQMRPVHDVVFGIYADCRPTDWTFLHTACRLWEMKLAPTLSDARKDVSDGRRECRLKVGDHCLNCRRLRQCVQQCLQNTYVVDASPRCHQYVCQRHFFQLTIVLDERKYREQLSKWFCNKARVWQTNRQTYMYDTGNSQINTFKHCKSRWLLIRSP